MLGRSELNYPGSYWLADRGKYYRFTPNDVLVIRPWPLPQAWFKENHGSWGSAAPTVEFQEAHRYREQLDGVLDVVQLDRVQVQLDTYWIYY